MHCFIGILINFMGIVKVEYFPSILISFLEYWTLLSIVMEYIKPQKKCINKKQSFTSNLCFFFIIIILWLIFTF